MMCISGNVHAGLVATNILMQADDLMRENFI